ncbi:MAG: isoprenylcysteine carboxylmethyltransferase family protein [Anaerolineales bacterium]|nr:isoprenylcysteine carboxylmethyltransferase family protein [Anaerolineales bacterium]
MNEGTVTRQPTEKPDLTRGVAKRMVQVVFQTAFLVAIPLVSAGRLDWVWPWAYLGVGIGILAINMLILSPELMAERGQPRENVKDWDKVLASLITFPILALLIVAGLDERFGWSPQLALVVHLIGLAFIALGQGLFTWAMASNMFFSTAVRIQMDRDHTVASGGPYRYVRHPGYVGLIVSLFATALALGSLWALMPAGLAAVLLGVRTALEDKTLLEELEGYEEYAAQTRYRMLPGIW